MTALAEYALLPIAFSVDQVLDVTTRADGGFDLSPRRLEVPYVKDYDAVDGEGPLHWSAAYPGLPGEIQFLRYKDLRA